MAQESIETFDLVVFLAVARNGSFGAAAHELRLAAPSVSARMAALERKLSAALFVRTARGSRLTSAGERFRSYAQRCLDVLDEAHHTVPMKMPEPLVVAAPASLGAAIFAPVLRLLNEIEVAGQARVADSNAVIDQLLDGSADVGFVVNGVVPSTIVARRLCRSRLFVISRAGHALARSREVTLHDMLEERIAVYRWEAQAEALAETFHHPRRPPDRAVQLLGLPSAVIELVLDADFLGVVPEFGVASTLPHGEIAILRLGLPRWALDVHLVHRRESSGQLPIKALVKSLPRIAAVIHVPSAP